MTLELSIMFFLGFMVILNLHSGITASYITYSMVVSGFNFEFSFVIDCMSVSSVCLVLFISSCVFMFSHAYMSGDVNGDRFILLLGGFVLSMIILLVSSSVPLLLVGWDGLGVTSFLLIVYYDSKTNNRSGMITFGVNRLGDAILISTLIFFISDGSMFMGGSYLSLVLVVSYMLISMTKSAQYPFSMWLPLAMDAPTPVSALVHSSTLVTAGLFLMARIIPESYNPFLLLIGGATLCVGGLCAVFSTDLKKLIANSTLSNLGLMAFILSLSDKTLMMFHLYTHALFKAGLFITAGAMLMSSFGAQDSRSLHGSGKSSPLLGSLVAAFLISSMGLFFLSTFFSKHQIALMAQMMPVNLLSLVMMGLGVLFTCLYSMRFSYIMLSSTSKMSLTAGVPLIVSLSIGLLASTSISYGNYASSCLLSHVFCYEMPVNYIVLLGMALFLCLSNNLSSNTGKSMLQLDSVMDSLVKASSSAVGTLQLTDMGYGSLESKKSLETVSIFSSLMVGTLLPNRVNLSMMLISLCSMLLFF